MYHRFQIPVLILVLSIIIPSIAYATMPMPGINKTFMKTYGAPPEPLGIGSSPIGSGVNYTPTSGGGINGVIPKTGNLKVIMIPVQFSDKSLSPSAAEKWEGYLTKFETYYNEISGGALTITATIMEDPGVPGYPFVVTLPNTMGYYGTDTNSRLEDLVRDTVNASTSEIDFADYHSLVIIHAGDGDESVSGGNSENIFSVYYFNTGTPIYSFTQNSTNVSIWGSLIVPESENNGSPYGTLCHEFGHQMTCDDFYDYSGDGYVGGVGEWSLMGHGNWGKENSSALAGSAPAPMSPYNRARLGWITPVVIDRNYIDSDGITQNRDDVYKVWTNGQPGDEYFLLEARGLVTNMPYSPEYTEGLIVWHVDESKSDNNGDTSDGQNCRVMQADGYGNMNRIESGVNPELNTPTGVNRGDSGDVFPGRSGAMSFNKNTTPNSKSWSGIDTKVALKDIEFSGSGTGVSAKYKLFIKNGIYINAGNNQSGNLNTQLPLSLKVQVNDGVGNPVSGVAVSYSVKSGSGTLSASSDSTDGSGFAEVNFTPTAAGAIQVEVSSTDAMSGESDGKLIFSLTGVDSNSTISTQNSIISIYPSTLAADGIATSEVFVMVNDTEDNGVEGATVTLNISGNGSTQTPESAITNSQGQAVIAVSSIVEGTKTVDAFADGIPVGTQGTINFTGNTALVVSPSNSQVAASKETATSDGNDFITVTTTIYSTTNQLMPGITVNLSVSGTGNTHELSVITNSSGEANFAIYSTVAEAKTVTFVADDVTLDTQLSVEFVVAPTVSASLSTVIPNSLSVIADGNDSSEITIIVKSTENNIMEGVTVSLSSTGSGNSITPATLTTNVSGEAKFKIISTNIESKTITVTANGVILDTKPVISFISSGPAVSDNLSQVSVSPETALADGSAAIGVIAQIVSTDNSPIENASVTLNVTGSGNIINPLSVTTNSTGMASFSLTSTVAESKIISVIANGVTLTTTKNVEFTSTGVDISTSLSDISADTVSLPADGSTLSTITVLVKSSTGELVSGTAVSLSDTGDNTITPATVTTGTDGTAVFTIKSIELGTKTITASAGGVIITKTLNIEFTAAPRFVSTDNSMVEVNKTTLQADDNSFVTVTVTVKDTLGAVYGGITVNPEISGTGNTITPQNAVSGTDGRCTFTIKSNVAESKTITIKANNIELSTKPVVVFTEPPRAVSPVNSMVQVSPTTVFADGTQYSTIIVTVKDNKGEGEIMSGITVLLNITGSNTILSPQSGVTGVDGVATFTLKSTVTGEKQITANADGVTISTKPVVTFVNQGVSAVRSGVSATPLNDIIADGNSFSKITIVVKSVQDQFMQNIIPQVEISGSGNIITPNPPNPTNADGETEIFLKSTAIGVKTVKITANGVLIQDSPNISFKSGTATEILIVSSTNNQSSIVTQNPPSPLKVKIIDANNNPVEGYTVNFSISSVPAGSLNTSIDQTVTTDINGLASSTVTTGTKTGVYTFIASAANVTGTPISFTLNANAGAPTTMVKNTTTDNQSGAVFTQLTSPLEVSITDAGGNPVRGVPVAFTNTAKPVNSTDPLINPVTPITDSLGKAKANVSLGNTAGTYKFAATVTGLAGSPMEFTSTAVAGVAYRMELISGNNQTAIVGQSLPLDIKVKLTDSGGNLVENVDVSFSVTGGSGSFTGSMPVKTSATGIAQATLQLGQTAGNVNIAIQANVTVGKYLVAKAISTAGTASGITIVSGNNQSSVAENYTVYPLKIKVLDGFGNGVSGINASFSFTSVPSGSSGHVLGNTIIATNSEGYAESTFLGGNKSGIYKISSTYTGNTGAAVEFIIDVKPGMADPDVSFFNFSYSGDLIANGESSAMIYIFALDKNGNIIKELDSSNFQIFSSVLGDGITQPYEPTNTSGRTFGKITSTRVGTKTIGVKIQGITLTNSKTLNFVPGSPDMNSSYITADPQGNAQVDKDTVLLTVTLLDKFYNIIENYDASKVWISATGIGNSITQPATVSTAEGKVFGSISSSEAGYKQISVKIDNLDLVQSPQLTISFVTKPIDSIKSTLLYTSGTSVIANGTENYVLTLKIKDIDNMPVSGIPVSAIEIKGTNSETLNGVARTPTDANGETIIDVRSTTAGNIAVNAYVSGIKIAQAINLQFDAGVAKNLSAYGTQPTSGQAGTQINDKFRVFIGDQNGNAVSGITVNFAVTTKPVGAVNDSLSAASFVTGNDGIAEVLFTPGTKTGTYAITASSTGLTGSPKSFSVAVSPALLARFLVNTPSTSINKGEVFNGVGIIAVDQYNNIKTDFAESIYFECDDPLAILPYVQTKRYTFVPSDFGSKTINGFIFLNTGSFKLKVVSGTILTESNAITVSENVSQTENFKIASFQMPGDPSSVFVLVKPVVALNQNPEIKYHDQNGIVTVLTVSAMKNNIFMGTGRVSNISLTGGKIYVIGVKSGTLEYVTGQVNLQ